MNFLQLCKAVAADSGTIAGLPNFVTVAGATGRIAQLVGWVSDAYVDIQNERNDWKWLNSRFTAPLTVGENTYTPADLGVLRVARWLHDRPGKRTLSLYETAKGREDEGALDYIDLDTWEDRYDIRVHDNQRPTSWSISDQNELLFGPTPDKAYTVRGKYLKSAQILAADTDTPEMPAQFHRVIVAEAIRLMSRSDEAYEPLTAYGSQYDRLRNALIRECTPDASMFFGGPLA